MIIVVLGMCLSIVIFFNILGFLIIVNWLCIDFDGYKLWIGLVLVWRKFFKVNMEYLWIWLKLFYKYCFNLGLEIVVYGLLKKIRKVMDYFLFVVWYMKLME